MWHPTSTAPRPRRRADAAAGGLVDTGRGYPAWLPDTAGAVRGTLVELRDPVAGFPAMDAYEGPEYRRLRVVIADPGGGRDQPKSPAVKARGSTSTIQFPELSRATASTP